MGWEMMTQHKMKQKQMKADEKRDDILNQFIETNYS